MADEFVTLQIPQLPTLDERAATVRAEAKRRRALWALGAGDQYLTDANQLDAAGAQFEREALAELEVAAMSPAEVDKAIGDAEIKKAADDAAAVAAIEKAKADRGKP